MIFANLVLISEPRRFRCPSILNFHSKDLGVLFPNPVLKFRIRIDGLCMSLFWIRYFWNLFRGVLALCILFAGCLVKSVRSALKLCETKC